MNSSWSLEDMETESPNKLKRIIAQKNIKFFNIDANKIATQNNLGVRINMIMDTVFLKLINILDFSQAINYLKEDIKNSYEKEGDIVVNNNYKAVDETSSALNNNGRASCRAIVCLFVYFVSYP